MNIVLEKFSMHLLSVENDSLKESVVDGAIGEDDINNYIKYIIKETMTPPKNQQSIRGQYFKFQDMNELVAGNLKKIVLDLANTEWGELTKSNAQKLLTVEKETQVEIERLDQNIREGSLLQIKCRLDDQLTLFLVKIDDNTYLDHEIMQFKTGLPTKTRMQKVAIIKFNDKYDVESLLLSDTNATISKYWRQDFLVTETLRDEKTNTNNAFNAIDKLLKSSIKNKSQKDYYFIRNQLVIDFRKESFAFNDFVETLKIYEPVNSEKLDKGTYDKFIKKLETLPGNSKSGFDTQFDIEPKVIKKKLNNRIIIDDNFELTIKGEVSDLRDKLITGIDEVTNKKYVKIYSDDGYNMLESNKPAT